MSNSTQADGTFDKTPIRALFTTIFVIATPVMLAGTLLLFYRRKIQPIRGRSISLLLLLNLVLISYMSFVCIQWFFQPYGYACGPSIIFGPTHNFFLAVLYVIRCFRLYFKAQLAKEIAMEQKARKAHVLESQIRNNSSNGNSAQQRYRYYRPSPAVNNRMFTYDEGTPGQKTPKSVPVSPELHAASPKFGLRSGTPVANKSLDTLQLSIQLQKAQQAIDARNSVDSSAAGDAVAVRKVSISENSLPTTHSGAPVPHSPSNKVDGAEVKPTSHSPHSSLRPSVTKGQRRSQLFAFHDNANPELSKTSEAASGLDLWFLRHRYLMKTEYILGIIVIALVLILIIPEVLVTKVAGIPDDEPRCISVASSQYVTISVIFFIAVFCYAGWKVHKVDEGLKMKAELLICAIGAGLSIITYAVAIFLLDDWSTNTFPLYAIASLEAVFIFFVGSTLQPIYYSYKLHKPVVSAAEVKYSLTEILNDAEGADVFAEHLRREFALENLVFWESVEDFKMLVKDAETEEFTKRDMAFQIYTACIEVGSPYEVNIPFVIKAPLKDALFPEKKGRFNPRLSSIPERPGSARDLELRTYNLEELAPIYCNFFDEAQKCVFHLLESDSFRRFAATDAYAQYCKARHARVPDQAQSQPQASPPRLESSPSAPVLSGPHISANNSRTDLLLPAASSQQALLSSPSGLSSTAIVISAPAEEEVTITTRPLSGVLVESDPDQSRRISTASVVGALPTASPSHSSAMRIENMSADEPLQVRSHRMRSLLQKHPSHSNLLKTPVSNMSGNGSDPERDSASDDDQEPRLQRPKSSPNLQ